jgi:hypothetical protein
MRHAGVTDMLRVLAGNPFMHIEDAAYFAAVRTGGNPNEILSAYLDARHA